MSKLLHKPNAFPVLYKATKSGAPQQWSIRVEVLDCPTIVIEHGRVGGKMQTERIPVREGKNKGKKNATTPEAQALAEAKSRHTEQQERGGYGLTPDASAAIRFQMAMLAQDFKKQSQKIVWDHAFAQPKFDGFRCLAKRENGKITLLSRKNVAFTAPAHIAEAVKPLLHDGETLDGELYCHGMPLNKISSACMKRSDLTDRLNYVVYDMPADLPYGTRYDRLSERLQGGPGCVEVAKTVIVTSLDELTVCESEFLSQGYEGAILRHGRAGYQGGCRSANLLKVKQFKDAEFEVIDFKPGTGSWEGVAMFICQTEDGNVFDVVAPGSMEEKRQFLVEASAYVGRKLTVKYPYFTKTAEPVPFQPVAKGFFDE